MVCLTVALTFSPYIYKFSVENPTSGHLGQVKWERVNVVEGKMYNQSVAGHTTVYHQNSQVNSMIRQTVFG